MFIETAILRMSLEQLTEAKETLPNSSKDKWMRLQQVILLLVFSLFVANAPSIANSALASGRTDLVVVKPVTACADLARVPLAEAVGAQVTLQTKTITTPKGIFCQATGTIEPAIGFEIDLPAENWTQRFLQTGCGGLCGSINANIGNAGKCLAALEGEFALAASDLGHKGQMGSPDENAFADDPQKRIDFAYRANHLTALVAKALIHAYYGQVQRYSYFSGCSDGGREALMEAERYPDDFDGVSAGAPAMLFQIQNSFFHAWIVAANTRPDGSHILLADKLPILHAAVLSHCQAQDGVLDDPRDCKIDPVWVKCSSTSPDKNHCLSEEEWAVAEKLYRGPVNETGRPFLPGGLQPGSELQWATFIPRGSQDLQFAGMMAKSMAKVVLTDATQIDTDPAHYPFTSAQFARMSRLHPLNDATDPNLRHFAAHGGKLILWHGWSDTSIAPMISVAYADAVRREMGAEATADFLRLYMLPGVGHCGGGDGFQQFDTLSALMDWVEIGRASSVLSADKIEKRDPFGPPPEPLKLASTSSIPGGLTAGPDGRGGFPGGPRLTAPYAIVDQPALKTRAIAPLELDGNLGIADSWLGAELLHPGFQKSFAAKQGKLVEAP